MSNVLLDNCLLMNLEIPLTADVIETTTFSEIRKGDVLQIVDDGRTVAATVLEIGNPGIGSTLLPVAIQVGLLRYAYDREQGAEALVLAKSAEDAEDAPKSAEGNQE